MCSEIIMLCSHVPGISKRTREGELHRNPVLPLRVPLAHSHAFHGHPCGLLLSAASLVFVPQSFHMLLSYLHAQGSLSTDPNGTLMLPRDSHSSVLCLGSLVEKGARSIQRPCVHVGAYVCSMFSISLFLPTIIVYHLHLPAVYHLQISNIYLYKFYVATQYTHILHVVYIRVRCK